MGTAMPSPQRGTGLTHRDEDAIILAWSSALTLGDQDATTQREAGLTHTDADTVTWQGAGLTPGDT